MSTLEEQEAAEAEEAANEQPDEQLDADDELDQEGEEDEESLPSDEQVRRARQEQASEIEKTIKKLDAEAVRHANRVEEVMGEDFVGLVPCELCWEHAPGFRWDRAPDDATTAKVRPVIGLPALDNLEPSSTSRRCEVCNGKGQVKTGSDDPRFEKEKCDPCNGKGYIRTRPLVNEEEEQPEPAENGLPPQSRWDDDVIRDMFGTPITDEDYGKMPALRKRPIEYWQTHSA